jgi:hypothetical protein
MGGIGSGNKNAKPPSNGRPKGAKNKFTNLKNAFVSVLEQLGGEEWILERAQDPTGTGARDFFMALTKMLPREIDATVKGEMTQTVIIKSDGEGKK